MITVKMVEKVFDVLETSKKNRDVAQAFQAFLFLVKALKHKFEKAGGHLQEDYVAEIYKVVDEANEAIRNEDYLTVTECIKELTQCRASVVTWVKVLKENGLL